MTQNRRRDVGTAHRRRIRRDVDDVIMANNDVILRRAGAGGGRGERRSLAGGESKFVWVAVESLASSDEVQVLRGDSAPDLLAAAAESREDSPPAPGDTTASEGAISPAVGDDGDEVDGGAAAERRC